MVLREIVRLCTRVWFSGDMIILPVTQLIVEGYSIKESGFGHIVNLNLDSENCILLANLNSDSVSPA